MEVERLPSGWLLAARSRNCGFSLGCGSDNDGLDELVIEVRCLWEVSLERLSRARIVFDVIVSFGTSPVKKKILLEHHLIR